MEFRKIAIWSLLLASFLPVTARDSQFTRKGTGPMYWMAYEYCYTHDKPLPEDRYKKNIDWINDNFKEDSGSYVEISIINGGLEITKSGYQFCGSGAHMEGRYKRN